MHRSFVLTICNMLLVVYIYIPHPATICRRKGAAGLSIVTGSHTPTGSSPHVATPPLVGSAHHAHAPTHHTRWPSRGVEAASDGGEEMALERGEGSAAAEDGEEGKGRRMGCC